MSETSPIAEQANPETGLASDRCSPEDLPHDALQTVPRTEPVVQVENLFGGAGRTQEEEEEELTGFPLPVSYLKPVGQAFEDNMKMIRSWLMDDEISTIGIYGMGGIGKTTMLQHIQDELLRRPDISHDVYWVTVPQDFSIYKLQNLIARYLDLDLSSEYDILPRAAKLTEELMKKQEWILILDDLWESFELSTVGIPVPLKKGCKVILTTRSNAICQRMGSQVITKVRPLSEREALTLFIEHLRRHITISPEVERIAVDIVRECAGLPLGIITMAGSLRGVDDPDEWRHTLEKLKESNFGDMEDKVFRVLRISYDRLGDFALQQSLLYCALFPEGHEIEREELIGYLIDEGIIQKMWSREAAFDKGHTMLDRLENAGLLQRIDGGRAVKMHDLVRDMAIYRLREDVMVQRGKGIEMAGSNIDRSWNHVEQTNDGGNSTHKTMGKRRKRIEMAPLKSGWTGSFSALLTGWTGSFSALLTGELERVNDLTGGGIELLPDTPDDQDELKKLKRLKSRDMVDDFKSGLTGAVSASAREQNNVEMAQQREPLLTGEFERANDLTGVEIELPGDTPDDQDELKKLKRLKSRDMVDDFKSGLTGAVSTSARQQNNVEMAQQQEPLSTGEFEPANDLNGGGIELPRDTPDELKKLKGSKYRDMVDFLKSGWTLLLTNLILEMASAVFDQLGHALVGMVLAFVALLLSTAELIYMERMSTIVGAVRQCFYSTVEYAYARQKRDNPIDMARRERMSPLPIFHRQSATTLAPGKPVGTIVEYFGWVGAVWQFFYSTVEYAYARQKKDNPIKMSLLPFIFLSCVVISKLIKTEFIDESA